MSISLEKVNFGFIRYANCWEDAEILLEGLCPQEGSRLISICSAGDNTFSLLTTRPEEIIAADVNSTQLFLTALKIAAIKNLSHTEYLGFCGFSESYSRWETYKNRLRKDLSDDEKLYWNTKKKEIEKGIIFTGKFEKYFNFFSHRLLPLIHHRKTRNELFLQKTGDEQRWFYNNKWNNRRWRLFFSLFFSKYVMGKFGRDPEFLEQVKMNVSEYIFSRSATHLSSVDAQDNYMLHFIINGKYGNCLPHYAKKENYGIVQNEIGKIKLEKGFIQDVATANGKFDGYNLSDIFEYMNETIFSGVCSKLYGSAHEKAKFAYWNLMVPRNMSEMLTGKIRRETGRSEELSKKDKGFFYHKFCIDAVC